jgi:hypothetical protein
MKRNLLLLAVAMMAGFTSVHAEDVTPDAFKFNNQTSLKITDAQGGANKTNTNAPGSITAECGPGVVGTFLPYLQAMNINLVDSKWGKLMMIKGTSSPVEEGASSEGLSTGWWNLCFIGPACELDQQYRVTIQSKLVCSASVADDKMINAVYLNGGNQKGAREGILANDSEGWYQTQLQSTMGATTSSYLRLAFPGGMMDGAALYIYEVRFEKNPDTELYNSSNEGDPGEENPIGWVSTGIKNNFSGSNAFVTWGGGKVFVNNAAGQTVEIYNVGGQRVASFVATDNLQEVSLGSGIYVVSVGGDATKVAL